MVPPRVEMSDVTKLLEGLLRVKVKLEDSPILIDVFLLLICIWGADVSGIDNLKTNASESPLLTFPSNGP